MASRTMLSDSASNEHLPASGRAVQALRISAARDHPDRFDVISMSGPAVIGRSASLHSEACST